MFQAGFISIVSVATVKSLWRSDVIWRHSTRSTLVQVMAWCRQAPSHHLNQCWFLINEIRWLSHEINFTVSTRATIMCNEFENNTCKITATPPRANVLILPMARNTHWICHLRPGRNHHRGWYYRLFIKGLFGEKTDFVHGIIRHHLGEFF